MPEILRGAVFLGAFLLFQAELIVAKAVLPWFGGTPSVWATNLAFYQLVLLFGYLYAHWLAGRPPASQLRLHTGLLALAALVLLLGWMRSPSPLTPGVELRPPPELAGAVWMLMVLMLTVGAPALALCTTAPLLQSWSARLSPEASPYPLYAFSNAGSVAGVLSYPLLVEPLLPLRVQGTAWGVAFLVYAALVVVAAVRQARLPALPDDREDGDGAGLRGGDGLLWLALAALPSAVLVAATNQISLDAVSVPLVWVGPLVLYLVSFIWAFGGEGRAVLRFGRVATVLAAPLCAVVLVRGMEAGWRLSMAAFLLLVVGTGCLCHGELARRKPGAGGLTVFYLLLAAGGALGGLAIALVAPAVFTWLAEVPVLVVLSLAAAFWSLLAARRREGSGVRLAVAVALVALVAAAVALLRASARTEGLLVAARSYFGSFRVYRVRPGEGGRVHRVLRHGQTSHGAQYEDADLAARPTQYFTGKTGVGRALRFHARRVRGEPLRVGVVGLGCGTLAAWGRSGDTFRFYELDPAIAGLSKPPQPIFTYLERSAAEVSVVTGDGRLSLEAEDAQGLDVLVVDAFTSGVIPIHLLTREALDVYLRHLRDRESLLAFNLSNRFLDLVPPLGRLARELGLTALVFHTEPEGPLGATATWLLLARDPAALRGEELRSGARAPWGVEGAPILTDDHSNVIRLLKRW